MICAHVRNLSPRDWTRVAALSQQGGSPPTKGVTRARIVIEDTARNQDTA